MMYKYLFIILFVGNIINHNFVDNNSTINSFYHHQILYDNSTINNLKNGVSYIIIYDNIMSEYNNIIISKYDNIITSEYNNIITSKYDNIITSEYDNNLLKYIIYIKFLILYIIIKYTIIIFCF